MPVYNIRFTITMEVEVEADNEDEAVTDAERELPWDADVIACRVELIEDTE